MGFYEHGNEMLKKLVQNTREIFFLVTRSPTTSGKTKPGGGPCRRLSGERPGAKAETILGGGQSKYS